MCDDSVSSEQGPPDTATTDDVDTVHAQSDLDLTTVWKR